MQKKIQRIFFGLVIFLIPLNIYIIGDWIGTGIQWVLFKYQQTYMGSNLISVFDDLFYISNDYITGKSALSLQLWIVGVIIFLASITYLSFNKITKRNGKIAAGIMFFSGILFFSSIFLQYGITLRGPAGVSIPIGIPLIFVISGYIWFSDYSDDSYTLADNEREV
jgi:hypothetical protein